MRSSLLLVLLAAGFTAGVVYLFGLEFAAGDVYPEYSSLRSDPAGTKLLFDSLARLPGVTVTRNYLPLETLREDRATLLLLATSSAIADDADALKRIEQFARRGNRVVVALTAKSDPDKGKGAELAKLWNVRLAIDDARHHVHKLYFSEAADWHVLDRIAQKLMAIERDFGKGSIVLFAECDDFVNQSTAAADRLEMISAALGSYPRIVFDEQHLGIAESGSVVGLARRFHLTGMALGLGLLAALFIWRSASAFPPPAAHEVLRLSGRTSHAGLLTLLRRHISPSQLIGTCWQEWLTANRRTVPPDRLQQAAELVRASTDPVATVRQVQNLLKGKT